jgi:hypothetical protein
VWDASGRVAPEAGGAVFAEAEAIWASSGAASALELVRRTPGSLGRTNEACEVSLEGVPLCATIVAPWHAKIAIKAAAKPVRRRVKRNVSFKIDKPQYVVFDAGTNASVTGPGWFHS